MKQSCPICGNITYHHVFTCVDYFVSRESFDIVECCECGMRMTDEVPDENVIGHYYETTDYISHSDTKKGMINVLYHNVRRKMLQKKAQWVEAYSPQNQGVLLDMGAGTGYFAHAMQQRGWTATMVEQSAQARQFAFERFGLGASASLKEYVETTLSGSLDIITLWHVLEHLDGLNDVMRRFYELLKPEGVLIIAVPNHSSYDARVYESDWAAYDVPRHLWHFTPKQMEMLAVKHGFRLVDMKPMPFDAFYISMMSEKYAQAKGAFIKGVWRGVCGYVMSLFDKRNSSSLVYVLRK